MRIAIRPVQCLLQQKCITLVQNPPSGLLSPLQTVPQKGMEAVLKVQTSASSSQDATAAALLKFDLGAVAPSR